MRPESDQYSLGLVFFEMLTGTCYKRLRKRESRPRSPRSPRRCGPLIAQMMASDPEDALPYDERREYCDRMGRAKCAPDPAILLRALPSARAHGGNASGTPSGPTQGVGRAACQYTPRQPATRATPFPAFSCVRGTVPADAPTAPCVSGAPEVAPRGAAWYGRHPARNWGGRGCTCKGGTGRPTPVNTQPPGTAIAVVVAAHCGRERGNKRVRHHATAVPAVTPTAAPHPSVAPKVPVTRHVNRRATRHDTPLH